MKDPHDIILRPVLTEKAYEGIGDKRYIFEVAVGANKTEIKLALESIFAEDGVKVEKVNTVRTLARSSARANSPAARRKSRRPM